MKGCGCSAALTVLLAWVALAPSLRAQSPAGDAAGASARTLLECVAHAATANLALARQRLGLCQAELDVLLAEEPFWPELAFRGGVGGSHTPGPGGADPVDESNWDFTGGVDWHAPLGSDLFLGLSNSRLGTSDPTAVDPEHELRLDLALVQPLLRGFGMDVNTAALERARAVLRRSRQEFRSQLNALVLAVEGAYWDLYLAQQDVAIKGRMLERAQKQYADTAENIRRGLLPEQDILVVEESLVTFQRKVRLAEAALRDAQAALGERMQLDEAEAARLVVGDQPDPMALRPEALEALERQARRDNPLLRASRASVADARMLLLVERDERWPQLDFEARLMLRGVAGRWGSSAESALRGDEREGYLGLRLALPLFRLFERAGEERVALELQRRSLQVEELEQAVNYAVGNLHRDLLAHLQAYELSVRISDLARRKLEAQQEKYRAGVAALKDLVQFLRELDEAEIEQLRALVDLAKRAAELRAVVGDLHRLRGVEVER